MEAELKSHILEIAACYAEATKLKPSTIAMRVARDARFFDRLSEGGGFTVKTYDNVLRWFSENWPEGAKWPVKVPRPDPFHSGAAA